MNSSQRFKMVFFTIVSFTFLSAIGCVYLSLFNDYNPIQNQLFEAFSTIFKTGFGTIVGLLSGKALS